MTRRISIFGATGSIGLSTIDLIRRDPEAYEVVALTGGHNIALLAERQFAGVAMRDVVNTGESQPFFGPFA